MRPPIVGISSWTRTLTTSLGEGRHHCLAGEHVDVLADLGGASTILPVQPPGNAPAVVERLDAVLISGGADFDPAGYGHENTRSKDIDVARDRWEVALVGAARDASIPVFGICRGLQVINVALGGTLRQHVWGSEPHPELEIADGVIQGADHWVSLTEGTRIAAAFDAPRVLVNSYHHQAVGELGDGMVVSAKADDDVVEAVESDDGLMMAVQWHPELLKPDRYRSLFRAALPLG